MCRHAVNGTITGLPAPDSKAPTSLLVCGTQGGFDLFDAVLGTPLAMHQPGAPASPECWPSPGLPPHHHAAPHHHPEGAVQRCLFSSRSTDPSACCSTLPRLIVPAAPFSSCYGGSPMQLPSTPASQAVNSRQRRGSRPRQLQLQQQQQDEPDMQEWLTNMELALSVGSRNNRGLPGASSLSTAAGEGSRNNAPGMDLPPPAFALLGVLLE